MPDWTRLAIKYRPKTIASTWIPSEIARLLNELVHAECIHVLVYCPLPHTGEGPQLVSVEAGKTVEDKIE